ncbi:hypothetical protein CS379_09935 [Methylobacterium frigidaeris]|nr:hypothetical protein CS379_09935 [Methylobacterium frigidaeris]
MSATDKFVADIIFIGTLHLCVFSFRWSERFIAFPISAPFLGRLVTLDFHRGLSNLSFFMFRVALWFVEISLFDHIPA